MKQTSGTIEEKVLRPINGVAILILYWSSFVFCLDLEFFRAFRGTMF